METRFYKQALNELREANGISLSDIARQTGQYIATVRTIFDPKNKSDAGVCRLYKYAKLIGASGSEVLALAESIMSSEELE